MSTSRMYKAEGIILKRKNVGEADRIITMFTKESGKIRLIAKGVRKISSRRAPHLEVFTRVRTIIHAGKSMESISEVEPLEVYEALRGDLQRVSLAYYLCDLIDSLLPEKQEHKDIYALLCAALDRLQDLRTANLYHHSKIFTLEVLWALGFLPRSHTLNGRELQSFIETITEKKLKSTHFARMLMDQPHA